jgi:hypothetical protein
MASLIDWVLGEVKIELEQAIKRFPPMKSPHEGFSILHEELDEMWDEVKRNDFDGALEEAIQVAAMAVRYILDLQDYTPPKAATLRSNKEVGYYYLDNKQRKSPVRGAVWP